MAYDAARQETVMIGSGSDGGITWTWDGHDWTEHNAGGPGARFGTAMVYDELRQVVVLFDGQTWEWDGVQWTLRSYSGPPWRGEHAMAYDSARGVTVLFGGRVGGFFTVIRGSGMGTCGRCATRADHHRAVGTQWPMTPCEV